ncbi:MAG TPA: hypothetical protein VIU13_18515 [Chryseolinea sp.]
MTIVVAQNYMSNSIEIAERTMITSMVINALSVLLVVVIILKPTGAMR